MSTTFDPLTAAPNAADRVQPDRPYYAAGVLLDAPDFTAEQLYHRGRLARALAYLHGSGTISGLRVQFEAALTPGETAPPNPDIPGDVERTYPEGREARILVQPGLAIDRLGRLIEVPGPACLRLEPWLTDQEKEDPDFLEKVTHPIKRNPDDADEEVNVSSDRTPKPIIIGPSNRGIVADIFIRFITCPTSGKTPAFGANPLTPNSDATNANVPARLRDSYEISLVLRTEATADLPGELPRPPWATATTATELHNALLNSWQETTASWQETDNAQRSQPNRLPEHTDIQNTTDLFLARLLIQPGEADNPPTATVDNLSRQFAYPSSAIAHLQSLST